MGISVYYLGSLGECRCPMRDGVFLIARKFGERDLAAVGDEKRIVTKSARPGLSVGNVTAAVTGYNVLCAIGIDERTAAGEPGAPIGDGTEIGEKQSVVFRSVGLFAGIAGAAHTRRAAERLYLQSGIIGHAPLSWMQFSDGTHFDKRITGKIGSVFDDTGGIIRHDFNAGKNLPDLTNFMLIVRSYIKSHIGAF